MDFEDLDDLCERASDHLAWIPNYDIPDPIPIFDEYYENYFDEESGLTTTRLKEIELGAQPSNEEYKLLLDAWLGLAYEGGIHSCEVQSMAFVQYKLPTGSIEWYVISTTGTSFEGINREAYGKFQTKELAIKSLCKEGHLEGYNDVF